VPIDLERTHAGYQFHLGVRAGLGGQEAARIPIYVRPNESPHPILKEIHWCEVAGTTLEAANPWALKEKVQRALERIAPGHEHIDLVYFARRLDGEIVPCPECERAGWYRLDELEALGVNEEIQGWSRRALSAVAARLGALESARGAS